MQESVTFSDENYSAAGPNPKFRLSELFLAWLPAIIPGAIIGVLLWLMFSPVFQENFELCRCISQYGESWFVLVVPVLIELPGGIITCIKVRNNSGVLVWVWVLTVIAIEIIAAVIIFFAWVMPCYSYLEFDDWYYGEQRYYFGNVMGNAAVGKGRVFDKERRLLYSGGLDNNRYDGYGEEYAYDKDYTFRKESGVPPAMLYKGEFSEGMFDGQGTYFGTDFTGTGSFSKGKYQGYVEHWYFDEKTRSDMLYKGHYWDDLCHGSGVILYENGAVYKEGTFDHGYMVSGTYYLQDGTVQYSGQWEKGTPNGTGTYFYANGVPSYYGSIVNGTKQGYGTSYLEDGTPDKSGWFENGEYFGPEPPPGPEDWDPGSSGSSLTPD